MDGQPTTLSQTAAPFTERRGRLFFYCLLAVLALVSGALFLTHNEFSVRCHADEPSKVRQIVSHQRNFNHPLLMLNTAQAVFDASGLPPQPQKIVQIGRIVTGVFAVVTVVAFAAAAYATAGPVAGFVCGVFLMLSPLLVEISHYFKEDPAMAMGLGLTMLGIALFQKSPTMGRVLLMAVGAALAASGKHLGAAVIPFCLYVILRQGGGWRRYAGFFGALLGVYALVNYQTVGHLLFFTERVQREVNLINRGGSVASDNLAMFYPAKKYFGMLQGNFPWPLLWFAGAGVWIWAREKKPVFGIAALLTLVFFVAISAVNKTAGRYLLPVICQACFLAGVGAGWLAEKRSRAWRIAGVALPLLIAAGMSVSRASNVWHAFRHDTRLEMARWINENLPADALIAQDDFGHFESMEGSDSPYRIRQPLFNAGIDVRSASMAKLASMGVRYVLVVNPEAAAAKKKKWRDVRPSEAVADPLEEALPVCKKLREARGSRYVMNISPFITLYRLP